MEIRNATEADQSAILEIINYHIEHTTAIFDYEKRDIDTQITIFKTKVEKGFPTLVATFNNAVIGFASYDIFRNKAGFNPTLEQSIYIKPDFTGKGIGEKLLLELIKNAKRNNVKNLIAVIDGENTSSIQFHKKAGYTIIGTMPQSAFKFNKWLDTVFLQLQIN